MRFGCRLLVLIILFSSAAGISAQTKKSQSRTQKPIKAACSSNDFSFPCPKGYQIILNGNDSSGIFLAKNTEISYSVFAVAPKSEFELERLMTETVETLLKNIYPKESQSYRWKDVEFINDKASSKFEVAKKSRLGFNGNQVVTIEYRHISMKGKNLIAGTVVNGFDDGERAEAEFEQGFNIANSGCFDVVKIIHKLTGEKISEEDGPCVVEAEATFEN